MALAVDVKPKGRLASALVARMNELDVTLRQLGERGGITYEHIRKIVKGEAYPSRLALRELCRVLDLDTGNMEPLAIADRIEKKYGGIPHALSGKHPELSLLAPWWDLLNEDQKRMLRIQIKSIAEANQGGRRESPRKPPKSSPSSAVLPRSVRH
jgi:transcriptional regulator with XRE-family HTH domain